jgi:dienelactone hydrolase
MKRALTLLLLFAAAAPAAAASRTAPERKTASTHPMQYDVSLPAGWSAERTWPVLVVIAEARREFRENLRAFAEAAKDSPYILVAPYVLTCGGVHRGEPYPYDAAAYARADESGDFGFDADGIAAVVADVHRLWRGEEKVFLTGWEAGGHTVWAMVLRYPERFRAAAPVSTNYLGRWVDEKSFSTSPARATLPVRVLFCGTLEGDEEKGRQFFLTQTKNAIAAAKAHGFGDVTFEVLPVHAHGPLAKDVLRAFAPVLGAR